MELFWMTRQANHSSRSCHLLPFTLSLCKLPEDTLEGYRENFQSYHHQHIPLFINFFAQSRIIEGGDSVEQCHQFFDQMLYKIISTNILEKLKSVKSHSFHRISTDPTALSLSSDHPHPPPPHRGEREICQKDASD
jgi:hypothetical protein